MAKYRIITDITRYQDEPLVYYKVQRRGWLWWHTLCDGNGRDNMHLNKYQAQEFLVARRKQDEFVSEIVHEED